jgi:molybdate transport system regulatory protein
MECKVMLRLSSTGDRRGLGFVRGIVQLLEGVDRTGSLFAVAREIGMAYSKAWRLIKDTEAEFGVGLLNRDGARGSSLTDTARKMVSIYHETLEAAQNAADAVFKKYSGLS